MHHTTSFEMSDRQAEISQAKKLANRAFALACRHDVDDYRRAVLLAIEATIRREVGFK
jgi:hypothetical protein